MRPRSLPWWSLAIAALVLVFAAWCSLVIAEVADLRARLELRVGELRGLQERQHRLQQGEQSPAVSAELELTHREIQSTRAETGAISQQLGDRWASIQALTFGAIGIAALCLLLLLVAHRRRRQAEAAEAAKARFIATLSHEIRSPLSAIVGVVDLLERTRLDRRQREYLEIARGAGGSLLHLVGDVLDLGKAESGRLQLASAPFDIVATAEDVALLFAGRAEAKGVEISVEAAAGAPATVRGDAARMRQILVNLVGNAVKFTPGGAVRVVVRPAEGAQSLRVEVSDTGVGMSAEECREVFEAYQRARSGRGQEGTGLGLPIARRLVEAMGGEIGVASDERQGSTFWFTARVEVLAGLPEPDPEVIGPVSVEGEGPAAAALRRQLEAWGVRIEAGAERCFVEGPGERGIRLLPFSARPDTPRTYALTRPIRPSSLLRLLAPELLEPVVALVVDDSLVNRRVTQRMIEALGAQADVAVDGREGLEMARERRYEIIFTDRQMPQMDGLELTRSLSAERDADGRPLLVALSGSLGEGEDDRLWKEAGLDLRLIKPATIDDIRAALDAARALRPLELPMAPLD